MLSIRSVPVAFAILLGLGAAVEAAPSPSPSPAPTSTTTSTTTGSGTTVPTESTVPQTAPGVGDMSEAAIRLDELKPEPEELIFPIASKPRCELVNGFGGNSKAQGSGNHQGIDIGADKGQAVYAVETGRLYREFSGSASGLGWGLRSLSDVKYRYFHLSELEPGLVEGDPVEQGQIIGYVGDTGNASKGGYHLHFEVRPGPSYDAVNPYPLLPIPSDCKDYIKK